VLNLLVVDDTRSVHAFLKALLAKAVGVRIVDVYNGLEAVDRFKAGESFDLVLLDWEMPELDGPGTLERMKRMGIAVPVIMMTTKNLPAEIGQMLEAGAADFMMKPFTADILMEKIESVTGKELSHA
jgi:two-component system chemotaxis response regulator CheY